MNMKFANTVAGVGGQRDRFARSVANVFARANGVAIVVTKITGAWIVDPHAL